MIELFKLHILFTIYITISLLFTIYFYSLIKKSAGREIRASDAPLILFVSFSWPVHILGLIYLKVTGKLIN